MLHMFGTSFNYIRFVIGMVMSCDIISDITCISYFLCEILVACGTKCIISFTYTVCAIRVSCIINNNTISKLQYVFFTLCVLFFL